MLCPPTAAERRNERQGDMEWSQTKLSFGNCRFAQVQPLEDKTFGARRDGDSTCAIIACQGPVLVFSRELGALYLCQPEPSRATNPGESLRMQFHDGMEVVPWHSGLVGTKDVTNLSSFMQQINRRRYIKAIRFHPFETGRPCIDQGHHYATISSQCLVSGDQQSSFCCLSIDSKVTSLKSVCFRHQGDANPSPLALARLKRSFVGLHIAFMRGEFSTELHITESGRRKNYLVESVTTRDPINKRFYLFALLPSTMITILPTNHTGSLVNLGGSLVPRPPEYKRISVVAENLIRLVRAMRIANRAPVPKSCILSGPHGVGKTHSVRAAYNICSEEGPTTLLSLGSLLGSGATPGQVCRSSFQALLSSRAGMFAMLVDKISQSNVLLVAATNTIGSIPSFLRRPGRFDIEFNLAPPTTTERMTLLASLIVDAGTFAMPETEALQASAEECVGYVAADLVALVRRAVILALEEGAEDISSDVLRRAALDVQASALRPSRSAYQAVAVTRWDDIAGDPGGALKTLRQAIEWPISKAAKYKFLGLQPPKGILLYGPPGCAKTSIARAAAGTTGSAFIAFFPNDIYCSSYVGEAERVVRDAFKMARSANPCVLFFDEIDAIVGTDANDSHHGMHRSAESRVLSTFLNEMDGVDGSDRDGVIVLAATNRPWTLDKALLRSGRFDKAIYVPPPDYESRRSIFSMFCNTSGLVEDELNDLASKNSSGLMTGAEIVGACREAGMKAIKEVVGQSADGEKRAEITLEALKESLAATLPLLSGPDTLDAFLEFEQSRMRF